MTTPGASDPSQRTPQERASDPATTALELQQLAAEHPEVRPAIAGHANAYPALLDWLGALGDSAVNAALIERRAADSAPPAPSTSEPAVVAQAPAETAPASASPVEEPSEEVEQSAPVSDDVAEPSPTSPVSAEDVPASPVTAGDIGVATAPAVSQPEAEPEATQISPVSAEPSPVVSDVESAARQRASVFAAVQAAQEQPESSPEAEDNATDAAPAESASSAPAHSPDVSEVVAGALGADVVTQRDEQPVSQPSAPAASAPDPTATAVQDAQPAAQESAPEATESAAPVNPFSREFSAQSPGHGQESVPATEQSAPEPSPYAPPGYGVAAGVGATSATNTSAASAPSAPAGPYGLPPEQTEAQGPYGQPGQAGPYGQPGYSPQPEPEVKVYDGRGLATALLISLALGASVIALWDAAVADLNPQVYGIAAAVLLIVAAGANLGVIFRGLRRGFAGLTLWAAWTFAALVPAVFYNVTVVAIDLADANVDGGSPLDLLMRSQNSMYSAIDTEWGRLVYMALPLILALVTFVVALSKRKAAIEQLTASQKDESTADQQSQY